MTKKYRRYLVLLKKQQATRNYCVSNGIKLIDCISYDNIMIELDALTYYFQKEFGESLYL